MFAEIQKGFVGFVRRGLLRIRNILSMSLLEWKVERRTMWNNVVNLGGGEDCVLAWKLKAAPSEDRVLFALGADSGDLHVNAPHGANRCLCRGWWKMYERRKQHLFDVVV